MVATEVAMVRIVQYRIIDKKTVLSSYIVSRSNVDAHSDKEPSR